VQGEAGQEQRGLLPAVDRHRRRLAPGFYFMKPFRPKFTDKTWFGQV
jgi:hypothetical protein